MLASKSSISRIRLNKSLIIRIAYATRYPIPNTQYPIPNTQYPLPNTQYPVPNTKYPVPSTQYPVSAQCDPDPLTVQDGHGGGVSVQADIGSGRPDDAGRVSRHEGDVGGGQVLP